MITTLPLRLSLFRILPLYLSENSGSGLPICAYAFGQRIFKSISFSESGAEKDCANKRFAIKQKKVENMNLLVRVL